MPKIKRKVEMTPKEFLKHLLEQEETEVELDGYTFNYNEEHYSFDPEITANEVISYDPHSCTFTVEIEEEITEDTVLPGLVVTYIDITNNPRVIFWDNVSINSVRMNNKELTYHMVNDDGTMTLIWKDNELVD